MEHRRDNIARRENQADSNDIRISSWAENLEKNPPKNFPTRKKKGTNTPNKKNGGGMKKQKKNKKKK